MPPLAARATLRGAFGTPVSRLSLRSAHRLSLRSPFFSAGAVFVTSLRFEGFPMLAASHGLPLSAYSLRPHRALLICLARCAKMPRAGGCSPRPPAPRPRSQGGASSPYGLTSSVAPPCSVFGVVSCLSAGGISSHRPFGPQRLTSSHPRCRAKQPLYNPQYRPR